MFNVLKKKEIYFFNKKKIYNIIRGEILYYILMPENFFLIFKIKNCRFFQITKKRIHRLGI